MPMSTARVEVLTWVLIFGGLLVLGLGIAVGRSEALLGWAIGIFGGLAAAVGFVLIWVRSRMKDEP